MYIIMTVALVAMMGFSIYANKKRSKQVEAMRSSISVGDRITTIGGIVGDVVSLGDNDLVIETEAGGQIRLKKWSINSKEIKEKVEVPEIE